MFSEITLNLSKNLKSLLIKKNMHLLITDPAPPPQLTPSCECLTRLLQKQLTLKIVGVLCISKTNKNAGKEQQSLHTPTRHLHQLYYHKIRKNSIYDMLKKSKY